MFTPGTPSGPAGSAARRDSDPHEAFAAFGADDQVERDAGAGSFGRGGFAEPPVDQPFRTPSADAFTDRHAEPDRAAEPAFRPQSTYRQESDEPAESVGVPADPRGHAVEPAAESRELPDVARDPAGSDTPDEALAAAGGVVANSRDRDHDAGVDDRHTPVDQHGERAGSPDHADRAEDDRGRFDRVEEPRNGVRYDRGVDEDEYVAQSHADTPGVHPATDDGPPYRVSFDSDSDDRFTTPPALSDPNVDLFTPQHFEAVPPWSEASNGHAHPGGGRQERGHRYLDEDPADSADADEVTPAAFERGADPDFDHVQPEFEDVDPTGEHVAEPAFEQVGEPAEGSGRAARTGARDDTEPASGPESPAESFESGLTGASAFEAESGGHSAFEAESGGGHSAFDAEAESVREPEDGHRTDTTYAGESAGVGDSGSPESAHGSESPNAPESRHVTASAFEHTQDDQPEFGRDHGSAAVPESNAFHESARPGYDEPAAAHDHGGPHPFDVESATEPTTAGSGAFHESGSALFREDQRDSRDPDGPTPTAFREADESDPAAAAFEEPRESADFQSGEHQPGSPAGFKSDRFEPDRFGSDEFQPDEFQPDQVGAERGRSDEFRADQVPADEASGHHLADDEFRGERAETAEHAAPDAQQADAAAEALTGPVFGGDGVSPFRDEPGHREPAQPERRRESRPIRVDEERELGLLRRALDDLDVPAAAYRFGEAADRAWCLRAVGEGWEVAWHDQGPTNPVRFDRIDDAAAYLVGRFVLAGHRPTRPTPPGTEVPPSTEAPLADEAPLPNEARPGSQAPFGTDARRGNEAPFGTDVRPGSQAPFGNEVLPGTEAPFGDAVGAGTEAPFGSQVPTAGPVPHGGPAFGVSPGASGSGVNGVNGVPGPAADPGQPAPGEPAGHLVPGQSAVGQPGPASPAFGQPGPTQPEFGQPGSGQPGSGQPEFGQHVPGQAAFGQAAFGQPGFGQPEFGQPVGAPNGLPDRRPDGLLNGLPDGVARGSAARPADGGPQAEAVHPDQGAVAGAERGSAEPGRPDEVRGAAVSPDRSRPIVPRNGGRGGVPSGPRSWPIKPLSGEPPLTLFRHKRMIELPAGAELDRFGEAEGNLTYQAGTPFPQRSLVPSWINRSYRVYRVQRPVEALTGVAVPWFEQPGGGTAFLLPKPIEALVAEGVLVEVPAGDPPA